MPPTPEREHEIIAALTEDPHASRVARTLGDVSYATVWRVAERAGIELTAGRTTMGRPRLSPAQRAAVIETRHANPDAPQQQIAQKAGVSRSTVWRIERGRLGASIARVG